jgi:nitronate monooxygenase
VQIGTAFLACDESNTTACHKQMLFSDAAKYTTYHEHFRGSLAGITVRIATDLKDKDKGLMPFPLQAQFMSHLRKSSYKTREMGYDLFWSGANRTYT